MKRSTALLLMLVLSACASAPREETHTAPSEIAELRAEVEALKSKVGHLESRVVAASPEGEFTVMTIDSATLDDGPSFAFRTTPALRCHVVEWKDFGRMLRFTRMADPTFVLEAHGEPVINGHMATGGISNESGSTRFAVLQLDRELTPEVTYTLRPRNSNPDYKWIVDVGVQVRASVGRGHVQQ